MSELYIYQNARCNDKKLLYYVLYRYCINIYPKIKPYSYLQTYTDTYLSQMAC